MDTNERLLRANLLADKIRCYAGIAWGIMIVFCLVGFVLKNPIAMTVLTITCVTWTTSVILSTAYACSVELRVIKLAQKTLNDKDK